MSVHPGAEGESRRRHQPIWQELQDVLLFGDVEIEDEARWAAVAETDICRRWWRFMQPIMPTHADASPVSRPLEEVFHLSRRP